MKYTKAVQLSKNWTLTKKINTDEFIVSTPFFWYLDYEEKNKNYVIVPAGFVTDFGSIPRLLWFWMSPTKYTAYILHDWLYFQKEYFKNQYEIWEVGRAEADEILRLALIVEGMNRVRARIVWLAVRLFGWLY